MKRIVVASTLISFAMICACQKHDSSAEQQLAQRRTDLDARETALNEREKALDEREKALFERENAVANARAIPRGADGRTPGSAQAKAERDRRIEQLPAEFRALIPDPAQVNSVKFGKEREAALQGQTPDPAQVQAERERRLQQLPPEVRTLIPDHAQVNSVKDAVQKLQISGAAVSPAAESSSPTPAPAP